MSPERLETKAIFLPSCDQAGPEFLPLAVTNAFWTLPSVESSQMAEVLSFSSIEKVVTSTAAHLPSGETAGLPTRWTFQRSSMVRGCLEDWAWAPDTAASKTNSKEERRFIGRSE